MPFRSSEIERLDADVRAARAAVREREHLAGLLRDTDRRAGELGQLIGALEQGAAKETAELERLERRGPLTLLYTLLGSLEQRRDRERREAVTAALRVDEARGEARLLAEQRAELERRAGVLAHAELRLAEARARKQAWLAAHDEDAARRLATLGDRRAELEAHLRALAEAAAAGARAAAITAKVRELVSSAGEWSALDLVGGQIVSSWVKHDCIDEARQLLPQLQVSLARLRAEANDVGLTFTLPDLAAPGGSRFVDVFLDNVVSDWLAHASLGKTEDGLNDAHRVIGLVRAEVARQQVRTETELHQIQQEHEELLG